MLKVIGKINIIMLSILCPQDITDVRAGLKFEFIWQILFQHKKKLLGLRRCPSLFNNNRWYLC